MEISFNECEAIVKTLPIGYYAKRRIGIGMDKDATNSYYSPMEDRIGISYKQISEAFKNADDSCDRDMLVRSSFYHEVSHAISTPSEMRPDDAVNIFEDERIETNFQDYYIGVDFKKNLYAINGGIHTPTTPISAFFNAVRFRKGPQDILDEVEGLLEEHKNLNRNANYWEIRDYVNDIHNLLNKVEKKFAEDPKQFAPKPEEEGEGEQKEGESSSPATPKNGGEKEKAEGSKAEKVCGKPGHGDATVKKLIAEGLATISEKLPKTYHEEVDKFKTLAENCIANFNKKNNSGNGTLGYAGIFNPRAVAREDYRYFDRKASVNGNNRFGTCHLNLFIDKSGSFADSQDLVNAIIKAMSDIESRNKNFTMDVVFCGEGEYLTKSLKEREIECEGGNALDDNLKPMFIKLQKPNTYNYNVVLFDGDAFSDFYDGQDKAEKIFSTFDTNNTTMITDPDNQQYINFHSARVVVTHSYTENLIKELTKVMTIAFH